MNINLRNLTEYLKKGGGIHIKEKNKGSFTKYCKGKVTQACIDKAKKSGNKKLIKKAVFAENARKWSTKRQTGGELSKLDQYQQMLNNQGDQLIKYTQSEELKQKRMKQLHDQQLQQSQQLGNQIGNIVGQIGNGLSTLLEDTEVGTWVNKVNTKFNDWLTEDDKSDTTSPTVDPEVEQNIKEDMKQTNANILKQAKQQLKSWKMDDAKVMESLKLPVINSDEILGNDFFEMLNKQTTI